MKGKYEIFNDIAQSRRHNNRLVYSCLILMIAVFAIAIYFVVSAHERANNNAYVLHGGQRLPMVPIRDAKENLEFFAKVTSKTFMNCFSRWNPIWT